MKRTIIYIFLIVAIILGMCSCSCFSAGSNLNSKTYVEETKEETKEETEKETVATGEVVTLPDTTATSPIEIPVWDISYDNSLDVVFKFNGENKSFFINAPVTGCYRFSFEISDVNCSYNIRLSKTNHEEIKTANNGTGFNADLTEGKTYVLELIQDIGLPECTIKIDIPNPVQNVENKKMCEKIRFIGQKDTYKYTALLSGKYGLQLDISNIEYSYNVKVIDSKNKIIAEGDYSNLKYKDYYINADLEENQLYSIIVTFDDYDLNDEFLEYTINIYEPNEIIYLEGNTVNGNMRFRGQQDRYIFSSNDTSRYVLEFNDSNAEIEYEITFCDEKNRKQGPKKNNNWIANIDLEKGMEYEIIVEQDYDYGKYSFNIVKESIE